MFTKILIANRGEIAIRIIRACKEMGIATVAVYSEADRESLHVALADQAICIGGPRAEESYLDGGRIVAAGTPEAIMADPNSVTGKFLTEERRTRRKLGDG